MITGYPRMLEASTVSGADVTGGCELLDGSAGNRMLVLWKPHDGLTLLSIRINTGPPNLSHLPCKWGN